MLADHGIRPVSVGTFSRYSLRMAIEVRKIAAGREITNAVMAAPAKVTAASDSRGPSWSSIGCRTDHGQGRSRSPVALASASLALMRLSSTALVEAKGQLLDQQEKREQVERKRLMTANWRPMRRRLPRKLPRGGPLR
jgi:CxxC motif-containing protein (DUF1111 family)